MFSKVATLTERSFSTLGFESIHHIQVEYHDFAPCMTRPFNGLQRLVCKRKNKQIQSQHFFVTVVLRPTIILFTVSF